MHTDEYEISIGREITLCRKMVKKLRKSIAELEEECGMTADAVLGLPDEGKSSEKLRQLRGRHLQLLHWEKLLGEYEEAYRGLKEI